MHYVFGCFPTHNINDSQFFTKHDLLADSFKHFIVDPIRSDFYRVVISFKRQSTYTMESKRDSMGHLGTHLVSVGLKGAKMDAFWVAIFRCG